MPSFPDLVAPLRSERVALRFGSERDIPEILIAHQDDPELYLRLGLERPPSGAQLGRREEAAPAERAAGRGVRLTILEPGSDTCRGQIDVHHVEWEHQRAELGLWLAPAVRGRGLAPDALRLAAGWLFDPCGLLRLEMFTETDNAAMVAAAERAGFEREGVMRALAREQGQRVDLIVLSLLPGDLQAKAPRGAREQT
jgi:RimJ/RimL family protein N-acetyltransferase